MYRRYTVPPELLEAVVFALDKFLHLMTEATESQVRALGYIAPCQNYAETLYFVVSLHLYDLAVYIWILT